MPRCLEKLDASTVTSSLAALLLDAASGVVTAAGGLVYLEASSAKTQSVLAVSRGKKKQPQTSPPRRRESAAGEEITTQVRAIGQVVDGSDDAALGLSAEVLRALTSDELLVLRLLAKVGSARTTELADCVGHSADRAAGMMRELRRKLHGLGADRLDDEILPDGEPLFRFVGEEGR